MNDFNNFSTVDLNKMCRVCMNNVENNYVPLFSATIANSSILLATKIMSFTSLQVYL